MILINVFNFKTICFLKFDFISDFFFVDSKVHNSICIKIFYRNYSIENSELLNINWFFKLIFLSFCSYNIIQIDNDWHCYPDSILVSTFIFQEESGQAQWAFFFNLVLTLSWNSGQSVMGSKSDHCQKYPLWDSIV